MQRAHGARSHPPAQELRECCGLQAEDGLQVILEEQCQAAAPLPKQPAAFSSPPNGEMKSGLPAAAERARPGGQHSPHSATGSLASTGRVHPGHVLSGRQEEMGCTPCPSYQLHRQGGSCCGRAPAGEMLGHAAGTGFPRSRMWPGWGHEGGRHCKVALPTGASSTVRAFWFPGVFGPEVCFVAQQREPRRIERCIV